MKKEITVKKIHNIRCYLRMLSDIAWKINVYSQQERERVNKDIEGLSDMLLGIIREAEKSGTHYVSFKMLNDFNYSSLKKAPADVDITKE